MPRFILFALFLGLASQLALAGDLVPFASPEGLERFNRSTSKSDAIKLMNHYRTQQDKLSCGPTTGTIVLNALRHGTQKAPLTDMREDFLDGMPLNEEGEKFDPRMRAYTPESFLNTEAQLVKSLPTVYAQSKADGKRDPGLTLEQLSRILAEAHKVQVTKIEVGSKATARNLETANQKLTVAQETEVLEAIKKNLATEGDFVIINYNRPQLKQNGGGHISPVGACDERSNSFLILDVNPAGGPWVWVDAEDLLTTLNTYDSDADANRGVVLVGEGQ